LNPEPLERVREAMREAGVDAVLAASPGLVAFLTGHVVPAHLAYPSRDARLEKPTLALVTLDRAVTVGADPAPQVGEALPYGDGRAGLHDDPDAFAALAAAAEGLEGARVAVELAQVPAAAIAALPRAHVGPLDGLLRGARAAKSDGEIDALREACALADAGQRTLRDAVRPGVSEVELYATVAAAMHARGGGLVLAGCELQCGARTEIAMGAPTAARVAPGDLVMCDLYPRHPNGWWADSCSTVVCGEPDEEHRRVWRKLHDGLLAGQEALRPGARAGDVHAAVCRFAGEQPGHSGHGIGRDHYEEPVIVAGSDEALPEGAVIVLEPGRYGAGRGMRLEWAFRVTSAGGEPLNSFPLEL
jgi:Xaa-Pro aminopeptidase